MQKSLRNAFEEDEANLGLGPEKLSWRFNMKRSTEPLPFPILISKNILSATRVSRSSGYAMHLVWVIEPIDSGESTGADQAR